MKIFIVYSNENMSVDSIYSNYESAQKRREKLCQSSSTEYTICCYGVLAFDADYACGGVGAERDNRT